MRTFAKTSNHLYYKMQIKITAPSQIESTIQLPSSKSICNRALILHTLANGSSPIGNLSDCDDTRVMIEAMAHRERTIDIMAAGTAMRFLTAFFAIQPDEEHILTGTERMQQRPIRILVEALRTLGADIEYMHQEGFPPILIKGRKLACQEVTLPGNVSSQYISALLMIAPMLPEGLTLKLSGEIISKPYIRLTLKLMRDFGANVQWDEKSPCIHIAHSPYRDIPYIVESDWSAASYWYEIAALSSQASIRLPGLLPQSFQGDSAVAELFEQLGVRTTFDEQGAKLEKTTCNLQRMEYNFVNQPDLAQTFVVTCTQLGIPFRFEGLQSLKIKETDRMAALITELGKLGFLLKEENDSVLSWNGERTAVLSAPAIDTYEDHRMAMAFAPICMKRTDIIINNPHVVSKSYPHYWEDLKLAGFEIKEI